MLFDSGDRALRLFLLLGRERLMSEGRLQPRLVHELGTQLGRPCDGLLLRDETALRGGLVWAPYKSQTQGLHSLCTRSFSIIDGPLL